VCLANYVKMTCCGKYTNLGCFSSCDTIQTTMQATQSGTHVIRLYFNGQIIDKEFEAVAGQHIILPFDAFAVGFNRFDIINPDGTTFDAGNCFSVIITRKIIATTTPQNPITWTFQDCNL